MASSVSGQDESNPALWLATRAGKMELSCPLGTTRRVPQKKFPRSTKIFIRNLCRQNIFRDSERFLVVSVSMELESEKTESLNENEKNK